MRVLFADSLPETTVADARGAWPQLRGGARPGRVETSPTGSPGSTCWSCAAPRSAARVFEAADRLALVIRAGAGTNTIDTDAAAARGVLVANVPGPELRRGRRS